jgi:uncharacterized protein (DUF58 family)
MTPRPRLLLLVALAIPVLIAGVWMPPLRETVILFNVMLVAVCIADILVTPSLKQLRVTREVSEVLSVGTRNPVTIHVRNSARVPVTVEILDEYPEPGSVTNEAINLTVEPQRERSGKYSFRPEERGRAEFAAVHIRSVSRFGH